MNDQQIECLLQFLNNPNYAVWAYGNEWTRFTGKTILMNVDGLPEYKAFITQGIGKYIDLYNMDINDLCVTQIVPNAIDKLLELGE